MSDRSNVFYSPTGNIEVWETKPVGYFTEEEWMEANPLIEPELTFAEQEAIIRTERDRLLVASDISQLADNQASMAEEQKLTWANYRQSLRDLPSQEGFPWGGDLEQVPWPSVPTGE